MSTVDTSFLLAGMLAAAEYFNQDSEAEREINLGPVVLMGENYRTGLVWRLMRACPYVVTGLRRAGFNEWLAMTVMDDDAVTGD